MLWTYKRYLQAKIDLALEPERAVEISATIARLEKDLTPKPVVLKPGEEDNPIEGFKRSQEELFFLLEQRGVSKPKDLTEYEFIARLNAMQKHGPRNPPEYT